MAKLTKLERPLADTVSEEAESFAEKWILKEAYGINHDLIENQIAKGNYSSREETEMRRTAKQYQDAKQSYLNLLQTAGFNPSEKDVRIMKLCAYANVGERDFGEYKNNDYIWSLQKFTYKGREVDLIKGYRKFVLKLFEYKKLVLGNSKESKKKQKAIKKALDDVNNAFSELINCNFNINNDSPNEEDRSIIFRNREFATSQPEEFFNSFQTFLAFAHEGANYDDKKFFNYTCNLLYSLYTRRNDELTKKPFCNHCKIIYKGNKTNGVLTKENEKSPNTSEVTKDLEEDEETSGISDRRSFDEWLTTQSVNWPKGTPIKTIDKEAVVTRKEKTCVFKHSVKDVIIYFKVEMPDEEKSWGKLLAGYCEQCNAYFVLESDFNELCKFCNPTCRILSNEAYDNGKGLTNQWGYAESRLHRYGYNVNQKEGLSNSERHEILIDIIEKHNVTLYEARSTISYFIKTHKSIEKDQLAVQKWQNDLEYLSSYKIEDLPHAVVNGFVVRQ